MSDVDEQIGAPGDRSVPMDLANELVALHKEQFGRGPTRASARFAGPDALLPAERALVDLGQSTRVVETRSAFQVATADRFVHIIERITGRKVRSFASGLDAAAGTAFEVCLFEPAESESDGP